jgi:hypothetical protein
MGSRGCECLGCRRPISERRVRSDRVVVRAPLLDDDLRFFQAVKKFSIQQLIAQLCCNIPASRQASGVALPCAINTSIWRSSVTICSALNLFFGMAQAPFQAHFLTSLGPKKPEQVIEVAPPNIICRKRLCSLTPRLILR